MMFRYAPGHKFPGRSCQTQFAGVLGRFIILLRLTHPKVRIVRITFIVRIVRADKG
jgi:hypothetical protein